jgi:hypothetical protein
MTKEQFSKILVAMAGNFGATIQPATLDVWFSLAKGDGLTYEQVAKAAAHIMRTKTNGYGRMPTYAEIVQAIQGEPPKLEHKALAEANRIISHLHYNGATSWPELSKDPITKHLMATRWPYKTWASQVLDSELKWWAKEFVEAYQAHEATSGGHIAIEAHEQARPLLELVGKRL